MYLPILYKWAGWDLNSTKNLNLTGLNSEFSFSEAGHYTKVKEYSLPYYLPIAERRIVRFIPFSKIIALCEMQIALSRVWTRVTMSISNDNNR